MSWNGENAGSVGHHDMLTLTMNPKSRFLKCTDGIEMVDSRDLRHGLAADLDFPHFSAFGEIVNSG